MLHCSTAPLLHRQLHYHTAGRVPLDCLVRPPPPPRSAPLLHCSTAPVPALLPHCSTAPVPALLPHSHLRRCSSTRFSRRRRASTSSASAAPTPPTPPTPPPTTTPHDSTRFPATPRDPLPGTLTQVLLDTFLSTAACLLLVRLGLSPSAPHPHVDPNFRANVLALAACPPLLIDAPQLTFAPQLTSSARPPAAQPPRPNSACPLHS